ncbi:unnamed protein product, partial [Meganyctiphanes norvegica]
MFYRYQSNPYLYNHQTLSGPNIVLPILSHRGSNSLKSSESTAKEFNSITWGSDRGSALKILVMRCISRYGLSDHYLLAGENLMLGLVCLVLLRLHLKSKYSYWARQGVQTPLPTAVIGHTLKRLGISMPFTEFFDQLYSVYGGRDFCGYYDFMKPGLFVGNPELVKRILVQDFEYFADRRTFELGKVNPIANDMLTNATGDHWRYIRSVISPAFTAGKTRRLFPLITQRGQHLTHLARDYAGKGPVEARSLCGRFTMDTIASCAFGIECESMSSEAATFPEMASRIFQLSPTRAIKILILLVAPRIAELITKIGIDFTSPEFHFFRHVVTHTLKLRSEKGIHRGDFLDLMMETRANGKEGLSDNTMAAQAILFLLAGYDNTANTLSLALYLLALNPQAQAALRRELAATHCSNSSSPDGSSMDHNTLMDLPYLDAVVNETLRLYPAAPVIERICTKNYRFGDSSVQMQKGQPLLVPVWSLHRDPQHWPQPNLFRPERFLGTEKQAIRPYTFIPFGKGPRSCIGFRFAMVTIKVGLAHLLLNMQVDTCERTLDPLPLDPKVLTLQPKDGVYIALNTFNKGVETHISEELVKYPPTPAEQPDIIEKLKQQLGNMNSNKSCQKLCPYSTVNYCTYKVHLNDLSPNLCTCQLNYYLAQKKAKKTSSCENRTVSSRNRAITLSAM